MTIEEREKEVTIEFEMFSDWMERYEHLIALGKTLPKINPQYKTEDYLVRGCQSQVWLRAELRHGKIYFTADSDAIITKGLVALMIRILSDATPDEILNTKLTFIEQIGLIRHLSPTRSNGLLSMIKLMKTYALGYKSKV